MAGLSIQCGRRNQTSKEEMQPQESWRGPRAAGEGDGGRSGKVSVCEEVTFELAFE